MSLTQQAISRSIKSLEDELGARLVERKARDRRGVGPTPFGRLLLPRARAVVEEMRGLRDQFNDLLGDRHTLVRLAAAPSALRDLLPQTLERYRAIRPTMRVQVMRMVLPSIIQRLADGAYDFVICDEPDEPLEPVFTIEPLLDDACVLVTGAGHPAARQGLADPTELLACRWVGLGPFARSRNAINAMFATSETAPSHRLETSSLDLVLAALDDNDSVAVLPFRLIAPELKSGRLTTLPVATTMPTWRHVLIYRAELPRAPAVEDFLDCLRSASATLSVKED